MGHGLPVQPDKNRVRFRPKRPFLNGLETTRKATALVLVGAGITTVEAHRMAAFLGTVVGLFVGSLMSVIIIGGGIGIGGMSKRPLRLPLIVAAIIFVLDCVLYTRPPHGNAEVLEQFWPIYAFPRAAALAAWIAAASVFWKWTGDPFKRDAVKK
jgi:hypothetical protein